MFAALLRTKLMSRFAVANAHASYPVVGWTFSTKLRNWWSAIRSILLEVLFVIAMLFAAIGLRVAAFFWN